MKKKKRFLLAAILMLFMGIGARAQDKAVVPVGGSTGWHLVKTAPQLKIYAKETVCDEDRDGENTAIVFLKIENLTKERVTVSWNKQLYKNEKCVTCNNGSGEFHVSITLKPSEVREATCAGDQKLMMVIGVPGTADPKLTSYSFADFNIN